MKGYPRVLYLIYLLATVVGPAQAQGVINEIVATSSDRLLRWDEKGQPRVGSGYAWFEDGYDDRPWYLYQLNGTHPRWFYDCPNQLWIPVEPQRP